MLETKPLLLKIIQTSKVKPRIPERNFIRVYSRSFAVTFFRKLAGRNRPY